MPRENIFKVSKADLEKPKICEFAELVSLFFYFLSLVNIVPPVSAIFAGLIIRDLSEYTSALVVYCMGFPVQLTNSEGDWQ